MTLPFKRFLISLKNVVEGEWNLSVSLPSPRYGNLHRLASLLNVFLKRLQTTITNIATTAIKVSRVAPELSTLAQTLESGSSDNFCFTISTPLLSSRGVILGVLGADVHFANILSI